MRVSSVAGVQTFAGPTSTTLTVDPVADKPVVTASATMIPEDGTSALTIGLTNAAGLFENPDDSVTLTVTLSKSEEHTSDLQSHLNLGCLLLPATYKANLTRLTI